VNQTLNQLTMNFKAVKVKLYLCLTKHYAMKAYGRVDVYIHDFKVIQNNKRLIVSIIHNTSVMPVEIQGKSLPFAI
jgi:hypothetical protein